MAQFEIIFVPNMLFSDGFKNPAQDAWIPLAYDSKVVVRQLNGMKN